MQYSSHRITYVYFMSIVMSFGKCIYLCNHHYYHPKKFPDVPSKLIFTPTCSPRELWVSFLSVIRERVSYKCNTVFTLFFSLDFFHSVWCFWDLPMLPLHLTFSPRNRHFLKNLFILQSPSQLIYFVLFLNSNSNL